MKNKGRLFLMSGIPLKCEQSQSAKREIKLASCASRRPVTSALRKWRQYICQGMHYSALPLRHGSLPARYPGKWGKNYGRRNGFLTATSTQKTHVDSAIKKSLLWLNDKAP